MTREEKLYSMKMADLAEVAEKLGIKINKKAVKSEAVQKILTAEAANKTAEEDAYVAEIMQQKKELGIEVEPIDPEQVTIEEVTCTTDEKPNDVLIIKKVDNTLLAKFTKKEQKAIVTLYKGEDKMYHVCVDHNGHVEQFDDKSLLRIGLAIRAIVKGE